jgi:hypothetical protein
MELLRKSFESLKYIASDRATPPVRPHYDKYGVSRDASLAVNDYESAHQHLVGVSPKTGVTKQWRQRQSKP